MSSKKSERQLAHVTGKSLAAASKALAPGDYLLFEAAPGLRLTAGKVARAWVHRYRQASGRIVQLRLGAYPAMTYAEAVATVEANNRERDRGNDPADARDEAREREKQDALAAARGEFTVEKMVEHYLTHFVEGRRKQKGVDECRRLLERDFVSALGSRPAAEITRSEATAFLTQLAVRAPSIARVGRREMSAAFDFAISSGFIDETAVDPWQSAGRDRALRKMTKAGRGTRFLTDAEIATLLKWLPESRMSANVCDSMRLVLLTGVRSGEAIAARWSDIDLAGGTWTLQATKTDAPRTIRLPRQAIALLESRRDLHPLYVFPTPNGSAHVRQSSLSWALDQRRPSCPLDHWAPHDLRRTVRTGLSRLGCPHEIAEAVLGHTRGGIAGVYDLHRYEAEAGEWLQRWCDHIDALRSPSVSALRRRA